MVVAVLEVGSEGGQVDDVSVLLRPGDTQDLTDQLQGLFLRHI